MPRKLSDTQLVILYHAFQSGGAVLPVPTTLKLNEGAIATVLKSLIQRGLVVERVAEGRDVNWREDKSGKRTTLVLTDDGFDAMGLRPPSAAKTPKTTDAPVRSKTNRPPSGIGKDKDISSPAAPPGSKQALLVDLLKREGGATLEEIVAATGWQKHSVRGAIAGTLKKKLGLSVTSTHVEGRGRVYRITKR